MKLQTEQFPFFHRRLSGGLREEVAVLGGGDTTFRNLLDAEEGEEVEEADGEKTE